MDKNLSRDIQNLIELERKTTLLLAQIKRELLDDIANAHSDGVTVISKRDDGPLCVSINISVIAHNGFNLSAETYCQSAQAAAVESAIKGCKTMSAFMEKVMTIYNDKKVARSNGHTVTMNAATLKILREFLHMN